MYPCLGKSPCVIGKVRTCGRRDRCSPVAGEGLELKMKRWLVKLPRWESHGFCKKSE